MCTVCLAMHAGAYVVVASPILDNDGGCLFFFLSVYSHLFVRFALSLSLSPLFLCFRTGLSFRRPRAHHPSIRAPPTRVWTAQYSRRHLYSSYTFPCFVFQTWGNVPRSSKPFEISFQQRKENWRVKPLNKKLFKSFKKIPAVRLAQVAIGRTNQ